MIKSIEIFIIYLVLLLPVTLITGPAIPDITITFGGIFFIILLIINNNYKEKFYQSWVNISFIFWIYLIFISFFAINKIVSIQESLIFIRLLIIPIMLYYWVLEKNLHFQALIFIIFFSIIFVCFDSIYQFFNYNSENGFGKDLFGYKPDFAPYNRLTGPFKDLVPGSFVSKFSLIGLVFILINTKNKKFENFFTITYLTLIGLVTFISGERMAFATYMLGLFLLFIFAAKRRFLFILSILVIFILIILVIKIHPTYNDYRIIESKSYEMGLLIEKEYPCSENLNVNCKKITRYQPKFIEVIKDFRNSAYGEIYMLSLMMLKENNITGIGLNNYQTLCQNNTEYISTLKNVGCVSHPHNFYLQWLVEAGPIGLILFLIYIFFIIKKILYKQKINIITLLSLVTLIIVFWPIMSTGSLLKNWMGVTTFFIIGVCLSLPKIKLKEI